MSITAELFISLEYIVLVIAFSGPVCYSSYSMAIPLFKDRWPSAGTTVWLGRKRENNNNSRLYHRFSWYWNCCELRASFCLRSLFHFSNKSIKAKNWESNEMSSSANPGERVTLPMSQAYWYRRENVDSSNDINIQTTWIWMWVSGIFLREDCPQRTKCVNLM